MVPALRGILRRLRNHRRDVPLLRGWIHNLELIYYPMIFKNMMAKGISKELRYAMLLVVLSHAFHMVSTTLVHNNQLYKYRSAYKRIDYASIILLTGAYMFPPALYFIKRDPVSATLVSIQWVLDFAVAFGFLLFDLCSIGKEIRFAAIFSFNLPNLYIIYKMFETGRTTEFVWASLGFLLTLAAGFVYSEELFCPVQGIFEHHETFHLLVFLGGFCCIHVYDLMVSKPWQF